MTPIPREYQDELTRRREQEHRLAERERLGDLARTCAQMIGCVLLGWLVIALSVHTRDQLTGRVLWWTGITVWIPGVLWTLLAAYRRGEKRGDW